MMAAMKPILCVVILMASCAWADEATDRAAVEKVISALSNTGLGPNLLTDDFNDLAELGPLGSQGVPTTGTVVISHEPWREATWTPGVTLRPPHFSVRAVRFVTPDVALVDGTKDLNATQAPVLFVMKKVGADWRIASVRRIAVIEPRP